MKCSLHVIGTGSEGNCYLLTVGAKTLIIEAGVNFSRIKKALNFDLSGVEGVLITHEHGDHACAFKDVLRFGKDIYCTPGTANALTVTRYKPVQYLQRVEISETFSVIPFEVFHDAAEPCGFVIEFCGKRMAFITDTNDLRTRLNNIDYWVIEANYSSLSGIDTRLAKRIASSHMSIDRCRIILEAHGAEKSEMVLLIHASKNNACKEDFLTKIPYAAIAEDGLIIDLI